MTSDTEQHEVVDADRAHDDRDDATSTESVRWKAFSWALGEILIVTVGILAAFSLEAWWEDRSLAQQEQVQLRALASDFERNVEMLRQLVERQEIIAASSLELLEHADSDAGLPAEALDELMREIFNSGRYEPVMGAYEGLVNSTGLTLIQDDVLRAELAQFAASVRDRYAENWSNEHYFAFAREFGGRWLLSIHSYETPAAREDELRAMLDDPEFQAHLAMRYYSESDMAGYYKTLLQQAEAVLARLRGQLEPQKD